MFETLECEDECFSSVLKNQVSAGRLSQGPFHACVAGMCGGLSQPSVASNC